MAKTSDVEARVRECLLAVTSEATTVDLESGLRTDLAMDLNDFDELVIELEDEFDLEPIDEAVIQGWQTLRDVVAWVAKQTA